MSWSTGLAATGGSDPVAALNDGCNARPSEGRGTAPPGGAGTPEPVTADAHSNALRMPLTQLVAPYVVNFPDRLTQARQVHRATAIVPSTAKMMHGCARGRISGRRPVTHHPDQR